MTVLLVHNMQVKSGVVLPLLTTLGRAEPVLTVTVGGGSMVMAHIFIMVQNSLTLGW